MIASSSRLVTRVPLIDPLPLAPTPRSQQRGRPCRYPEHLFLQALVIVSVRRITSVQGLLAMLAEETDEMQALRDLLTAAGWFPSHRTWERRLQALPVTLPAQIACFGQ